MNEAPTDNSQAQGGTGTGPGAEGSTPPADGASAPSSGDERGEQSKNFFDWIRGSGLQRSDNRWIAGVCGGIAARTGLDPMIVRGVAIVVALLGGPIFLAYAVGWALMPDAAGRIHLERLFRGVFDPAIIAIGAMVVLTFLPFMRGIWWQGAPLWWSMPGWLEATLRTGWILALVAGVIWLIVYLARRAPQSPREQARSHSDFWTSRSETFPAAPTASAASAHQSPSTPPSASFTAAPGTTDGRNQQERMADWSRNVGDRSAEWGERAGQRASDWGKRVGDDIDRSAREHAARVKAEHARRQPGAAFVAISLGLAVVAGAVVTNLAMRSGDLRDGALLIGLGTALGIIALATIVAGIRGRESSWLGFFGVVAVIALIATGVFPRGTQMVPFGGPTWSVSPTDEAREQGYAIIAGGPTLDLTELDSAPAGDEDGVIDVWMGAGNLTVVLPDDLPAVVEVNAFVGGIGYENDGREVDRGGMFYQDEARFGRTGSPDLTTVRVWTLTGHVDVDVD